MIHPDAEWTRVRFEAYVGTTETLPNAAAHAGDNTEMKSGRSMPGQRSAPRPQNPINVVGQHHGVGVQYAAIVARQQDGAAP